MRIELLLFLSFLAILVVLIACSVPRRPTLFPSPTLFPQLTLTMYDPQLATRVSAEAAIAATILPREPHLPEIDISPPRCYRTISPQLTCLGYLRNITESDVADISLQARYSGAEGVQSGTASLSLEQSQLPAGGRAPYRLQLPNLRSEGVALEIGLVSAQPGRVNSLALSVEEETSHYQPETNNYRYQATLRNKSAFAVSDIRLIVTLENEDGAVIGFRAADWQTELSSGATLPVELAITPFEAAVSMRHQVIALAQAAAPGHPHLSQ